MLLLCTDGGACRDMSVAERSQDACRSLSRVPHSQYVKLDAQSCCCASTAFQDKAGVRADAPRALCSARTRAQCAANHRCTRSAPPVNVSCAEARAASAASALSWSSMVRAQLAIAALKMPRTVASISESGCRRCAEHSIEGSDHPSDLRAGAIRCDREFAHELLRALRS